MEIRKAKGEDIKEIGRIYSAIHDEIEAGRYNMKWQRDLYPTIAWAQERYEIGDLYVMEDDGEVVATAVINHNPLPEYFDGKWHQPQDYSKVLILHSLVVDPAKMKKGYGRAFVEYFEQMGIAAGCNRLRLDTQAMDMPARSLYHKLGYVEADFVPCQFKGIRDIDLVLIEKLLPSAEKD